MNNKIFSIKISFFDDIELIYLNFANFRFVRKKLINEINSKTNVE